MAAFLPGIPTVPFQSVTNGTFSFGNVKTIVVDAQYAASVDDAGQTLIPPTLFEFASVFAEDLGSVIDATVGVVNGSSCSDGSIFVTLASSEIYLDAAGREHGLAAAASLNAGPASASSAVQLPLAALRLLDPQSITELS